MWENLRENLSGCEWNWRTRHAVLGLYLVIALVRRWSSTASDAESKSSLVPVQGGRNGLKKKIRFQNGRKHPTKFLAKKCTKSFPVSKPHTSALIWTSGSATNPTDGILAFSSVGDKPAGNCKCIGLRNAETTNQFLLKILKIYLSLQAKKACFKHMQLTLTAGLLRERMTSRATTIVITLPVRFSTSTALWWSAFTSELSFTANTCKFPVHGQIKHHLLHNPMHSCGTKSKESLHLSITSNFHCLWKPTKLTSYLHLHDNRGWLGSQDSYLVPDDDSSLRCRSIFRHPRNEDTLQRKLQCSLLKLNTQKFIETISQSNGQHSVQSTRKWPVI